MTENYMDGGITPLLLSKDWEVLWTNSTQPCPCLLSLPSSTSDLLMSSSGWLASLAHPPPPVLLHVKRDCVTDLNRTDDEYALCIVENGFKAKGTLLTSLPKRR